MLKLQIQGDLHLGVEDHLASSLTTGESRTARTLPHIIQKRVIWQRGYRSHRRLSRGITTKSITAKLIKQGSKPRSTTPHTSRRGSNTHTTN